MSNVETTAREWYAEGLRIGAESREERILSLLIEEATRTSVGTFNASSVLMSLIATIKEQGDK
jgi:hypothetical protein